MKLLKIGEPYINLDQVIGCDARSSGGSVTVFFTVTAVDTVTVGSFATFSGDEAEAIRTWLQQNAEDVKPKSMPVSSPSSLAGVGVKRK
jgi:hypothetical protein